MIETLEINLHRSKQIYEMNDKEVKEYKLKTENIEKRIIEGKVEIEDLKKQLDLSKEERKNKLEYDEMARNINKYPSRNQIQKHMDSLNKQINTLEKEYNYYEETINLRKKQFHTLLVSADEILYSIKQNREGKEYDWIKSIDEMTEDLSQDDESEIDENEDDKEDGMLEEKEYIDQMDES
jgi:THO complex subunit 7